MSYAGILRVPVFRISAIGVVALTALAISAGDADARRKKKRVRWSPPFSHIVLDAKTGKTLESLKADERRYPASLTKVMTLYLLFEQMEAGAFKLDTPLKVSRHAASQPPSKLGLKPGSTIRVEDAIKALVTKSANDVAAVVAEAIGGSEREFARMMTSKARALGMSRTVYANASGLPNQQQVTTARDQAMLGRAIQWHFPRKYKYFSTPSFTFRGRRIYTHNRLLGRVEGVDGIKTGYIRASGFNLLTSVRRDRRHIVAVVFGGRSGRARDAFMRKLIRQYIDDASPVRTDQLPRSAAAGAIDPDDLPMPPLRPAAVGVEPQADTAEASANIAPARDASAKAAPATATPASAGPLPAGPDSGMANRREADGTKATPLAAETGGAHGADVATAAATVQNPSAGHTSALKQPAAPARTNATPTAAAHMAQVAPERPRVLSVAAVATAAPTVPASLPYLLVLLAGFAGPFLAELWQMVARLRPRRQIA